MESIDLPAPPAHVLVSTPARLSCEPVADPTRLGAEARAADGIAPGGVLYYALGGGWGHLTRASAIARRFRKLRPESFTILTNCAERLPAEASLIRLDPNQRLEAAQLGAVVGELAEALRPGVLAVDAFPAGILGELPRLLPRFSGRRVAVLRLLQPHWIHRWGLIPLLAEAYDAVVLAEPGARFAGFPESVRTLPVAPILLRDSDELLSREEARTALGARGDRPLVCAAATGGAPGDTALLELVERIVDRLPGTGAGLRFAGPGAERWPEERRINRYPLLECMPGLDLLVGPCGYNLFHEAAAAGVPAVFIPQPRRYDDPLARAAGGRSAQSPEELETRMGQLLQEPSPRRAPHYDNGAWEVARLLAELLP